MTQTYTLRIQDYDRPSIKYELDLRLDNPTLFLKRCEFRGTTRVYSDQPITIKLVEFAYTFEAFRAEQRVRKLMMTCRFQLGTMNLGTETYCVCARAHASLSIRCSVR